jgi:hypothetical protein
MSSLAATALSRFWSRDIAMLLTALAATVVCLLVGASLSHPDLVRVAVTVPVAFMLVGAATTSPQLALYGLIAWLAALGLVRRLLTTLGSAGPLGDPLLLVGPALLFVLFLIAIERGAFRKQTRLSRAVFGLTVVLALSATNPLQGGLTVGLGGALLVIVPMLGFWIGRSLLDEDAIGVLVRVLGTLAVLTAIYGLIQTYYGMPSWDQRWITQSGYVALKVNGTIRAFGTASSSAEYATLLGAGILAWRAVARRPSRLPAATAAIALLATAVWLDSSRGIVVLTLAALWLVFAASRRISIGRALLIGALLLAILPTAVRAVTSSPTGRTGTSALVKHQIEGLTEPFGRHSTLGIHVEEVVNGIEEAFANPLGRGVGATTIAASKFEGTSAGTEADPGNAPVAAGFIGLILYLLVSAYGLTASYRVARSRRTLPALAALGILVVTFLQWLNGGQYAIVVLPWLFLGWVDAASSRATPPRAGNASPSASSGATAGRSNARLGRRERRTAADRPRSTCAS